MNRFLRLSSSLALCALLAVPAAAGAARDDFDLSASGISSSGYAQQLGAPKSYGSGKITLKMPKENPVAEGVNPITGEAFTGEYRPTLVSIDAHPAALPHWGAASADLIYEMPIQADGSTRELALFMGDCPTARVRFAPRACRCAPCGRCGAACSPSTAIRAGETKTT